MGILIPQLAPASEDRVSGAQVVDGSLKFDNDKSQYLTRTPGSAGSRNAYAGSVWVKRTEFAPDNNSNSNTFNYTIFSAGTNSANNIDDIKFYKNAGDDHNAIAYMSYPGSTQYLVVTNAKYRDPNGWYNVVWNYDGTIARLYVNGEEITSLETNTQNGGNSGHFNNTVEHVIGFTCDQANDSQFDGHMSQFYWIDGQALGPRFFGFTDPLTGTWRPKRLREGDSSINDGTVWSDGTITGTSGGSSVTISNPEYAFNADLSNGASFTHVANQESIITWTPPGGSFSGKNFRIYCYQPQGTSGANQYLKINNGSYVIDSGNWATVSANGTGWSTSQTIPAGTLTSISLKLTYGGVSTQSIRAIEIDGEILTDSASYAAFGTNGFYLPFDGNSPIGEDKSGKGNDWTPVNFGCSAALDKATGALPILNTDGGGNVANIGVRTDTNHSSLVLALPLVGIATDVSNQINSGSSTKAITNGGATASSANSNFYGGSFYFNNNISQYLSASSTDFDFGSNPFTVEFWFKHNETSSWNSVYFTQGDVDSGVSLYQSGANIYVRWGGNPSYGYFDFTPLNDKWYHFALVREGTGSGETKVYIDGISQTTWVVGPPTMTSISSNDIYIGKFTDNTAYENYGYMQDFRVYKGIAKYTSNFIPASTDPDILPDTPSGVSGSSNLTKVTDGAVSFNGTSDYLDIADSADFDMGTGDFTLECFVNSIDNSDYQGVFGSGDYDDAAVILQISNAGLLRFTQSSGTLDVSGTTDLQNTGWHHIVMCRSGTTLRGFVDGRQEISTTYSSSIDWGHSNNSIVIGKVDKTDYPTQFYYKGHISNLRLVKGTALYTSNFTPPTSPLTNVTNTKLLCCKSPNLAGSATVTPNSSLGNISRVWSEEGTGGGTIHGTYNKVAALFTYTTGTDVDSRFLSGSTSGDSIFYKPPSDIAYSSSFSLYLRNGDTDNSTISYSLDGGVSYTNLTTTGGNGSWVDISGSGTITSLYGIRVKHVTTAGTNAVDWRGIKVDSSILLDPVVPFGDSAPNTFNPFDTDINTVRGQETGYATLNPLSLTKTLTLSDGNLGYTASSAENNECFSNIRLNGGKFYFESNLINAADVPGSTSFRFGICKNLDGVSGSNIIIYNATGNFETFGTTDSSPPTYTAGNTIGVSVDCVNGSIQFFKDGVSVGTKTFTVGTDEWTSYIRIYKGGSNAINGTINFGQKPFKFPPPAGFQPLNAANVRPSTVIARSDQYFGVSTYTGTAATKSITSLAFQPDFVWLRRRDAAGNHNIQDVVRGASAYLQSDSDGPESTGGSRLASFDLNGFTVTGDNGGNTDGGSYVAWTWKAGGGKNTFNIDGVGYANASDVNMSVGSLNSSSYNQTQTWSNGGNTSNMQNAWSASFDGNFSNFALPDSGYDTLLTFSPAISYTTLTLMVTRDSNAPDLKMNGVALGVPATNTTPIGGTYKIERFDFYNGTLSSIGHATRTVVSQGGSGFYQIIVDGKILVDNGVTPPDLPSIASTGCSVGTKQGFSIIKATGSNSGSNIAHGLGKIPKFVIAKDISNTRAWYIYHGSLGTLYRTSFDTAAATVDNQYFGTGMTDTIVTLKSGGSGGNNYNGANMIYYVWADVPGLQKFGKYVSNGLTDGNFVELGFKPALLIIKSIDYSATTTSWAMYTSDLYSNQYEKPLFVNKNASEGVRGDGSSTGSLNQQAVDLLSNGFKLRNNGSETNEGSPNEYIYAAWAEAPSFNLFGGQSNAR